MRKPAALLLSTALISGCVPPPGVRGPSPEHGAETFASGIGYLVLAPFMIVGGLLEGIASLPLFLGANLHDLNRSMVDSQANVTLDETYRYAYETPIAQVPESGDTGQVFRQMGPATEHFQRVLRGYGVEDHGHYLLTAVRTADRDGYTLYAVVYRADLNPQVRDTVAPERVVALQPGAPDYYRPYARDAQGNSLDVVIDWAGVPRTSIRTQKGQAILMTLAANSVLINRRSDEYWNAQRRWQQGDFVAVVNERQTQIDRRLGT